VSSAEGARSRRRRRRGGWGCAPSPENFSIFELKKASFGAFWVLQIPDWGCKYPFAHFQGGGKCPPPFAHSWRRPWLHADVSLICLHDEFSSHTTQRFRALTCNSLCCTFFDCCVQTVFIIWRHYTGGEWNGTWVGFNLHFCLLNMGVFIEDRSLAINLRMKTQNWRHITRYACCHSNTLTQTQLDMLSASVK